MTRTLTEIYNTYKTLALDIIAYSSGYWEVGIRFANCPGYSGDTFVIDSKLLKTMYDGVLDMNRFIRKDTNLLPYATEKNYIYNTGSTSFTQAQRNEKTEFLEGRGVSYGEYWYLTSNNETKQHLKSGGIIHEGRIDWFARSIYDYYAPAELFNPAVFLDPAIFKIETPDQLNAWLNELDNALTVISSAIRQGHTITFGDSWTVNFSYSDIIQCTSTFSSYYWYDEVSGDSGEIVQQTFSGKFTFSVYSESVTFQSYAGYDPDTGEDIYESVTLPTSLNDVNFGDSARDAWQVYADSATDRFTANRFEQKYTEFDPFEHSSGNYTPDQYKRNISLEYKDYFPGAALQVAYWNTAPYDAGFSIASVWSNGTVIDSYDINPSHVYVKIPKGASVANGDTVTANIQLADGDTLTASVRYTSVPQSEFTVHTLTQ